MGDVTGVLNVVLLGKTGAGKSLSGNTILGRQAFISKKSSTTVTLDVAVESGAVEGFSVTVYDTPGLSDIDMSEEEIEQMIKVKVLQKCSSGRCVFLLVIKADRFTEEERKTVKKIEKMLGEKQLKNSWILFTRGDELEEENMTIQRFIEETKALKTLVQKYEHRYHVFNNKKEEEGPSEQVKILFTKIKTNIDTMELTQASSPLQNPEATHAESLPSMRIVLLGKSGVGKSASGNTILRQNEFRSEMCTSSVTSGCLMKHATVSGRSVSVVDTPGFFDTQIKNEQIMQDIARSVYLSSPGPHAFLIVFRIDDRFTEQEQQIPQKIELLFGEEVLKYSIILFTRGDQLKGKTIEKQIWANNKLRSLVDQCGGRYHVFNNEEEDNREQVEDLLQKIDSMIQLNGGGHYTNQIYEATQRLKQEEEERRRREEERQREAEREREEMRQREEDIRREEEKLREERRREEERREEERQREAERLREEERRREEDRREREKLLMIIEQRDERERMLREEERRWRQQEERRREEERQKEEERRKEERRWREEESQREEKRQREEERRRRAEEERWREEERRRRAEMERQRVEYERMIKQTEERVRAEVEARRHNCVIL